jgi:hypothetical protein
VGVVKVALAVVLNNLFVPLILTFYFSAASVVPNALEVHPDGDDEDVDVANEGAVD